LHPVEQPSVSHNGLCSMKFVSQISWTSVQGNWKFCLYQWTTPMQRQICPHA